MNELDVLCGCIISVRILIEFLVTGKIQVNPLAPQTRIQMIQMTYDNFICSHELVSLRLELLQKNHLTSKDR